MENNSFAGTTDDAHAPTLCDRASEFDPADDAALRALFPPQVASGGDVGAIALSVPLTEVDAPRLRADDYVQRRAQAWLERVLAHTASLPPADRRSHPVVPRFRLTRYSALKGCGCKVPQHELLHWMGAMQRVRRHGAGGLAGSGGLAREWRPSDDHDSPVELGVGMDASIVRVLAPAATDCAPVARHDPSQVYLLSTTDFFFPLIEDPYRMGRIAAANVLSDAYALGLARPPDTVLMLLCAARDIPSEQLRGAVAQSMMAGFMDACHQAGTAVTGGQTTLNPWPLIGGVAECVVRGDEVVFPDGAVPGDTLVLTKPLGTQVAVNLYQWLGEMEDAHFGACMARLQGDRNPTSDGNGHAEEVTDAADVAAASPHVGIPSLAHASGDPVALVKRGRKARLRYAPVDAVITPQQVCHAYDVAAASMARLNATAARLMHSLGPAHAATDVTGFGLLGHARNLAQHQRAAVDLQIDRLPVIAGMSSADAALDGGRLFGLRQGRSSETSGGLLIAFGPSVADGLSSAAVAERYCRALQRQDGGWPAWRVGRVVSGSGQAHILPDAEVIEVCR